MCYMIYLDNAASSFKKPKCVIEMVDYALKFLTANPGRGSHIAADSVATIVYSTREEIKKFLNAPNYDVIFTLNCTQALNLAIFSMLKAGDHVITTSYEHNAVLRAIYSIKGLEITILDCDMQNIVKNLKTNLKPNTKMIITNHISNVTGEECDIAAVGAFCKEHNLIYLVDGAQSVGHTQIDLTKSNVDMLAFAGHKGLYAITGVGGLVVKKGINLKPLVFGGTGTNSESVIQPTDIPEGLESGTLPSIPIVSLYAGVKFVSKNFSYIQKKEQNLSNYLYKKLKNLNFLEIYSKSNSKNVFSFNIKNCSDRLVADELNQRKGICVRSGLHCAPLVHKKLNTCGAVRVSLDFFNTPEEIDALISTLNEIANS